MNTVCKIVRQARVKAHTKQSSYRTYLHTRIGITSQRLLVLIYLIYFLLFILYYLPNRRFQLIVLFVPDQVNWFVDIFTDREEDLGWQGGVIYRADVTTTEPMLDIYYIQILYIVVHTHECCLKTSWMSGMFPQVREDLYVNISFRLICLLYVFMFGFPGSPPKKD